ncbi:MAG: hypothetical protein AB8B79_19060 [Granulosicoccus sp.]
MEWNDLIGYAAMLVAGLLLGYALGAKRSRKIKKRVLQQLNIQSLELLDAKSSLSAQENYISQHQRKDRLLKLSLRKLKESQQAVKTLADNQRTQEKKYFIELSRLRLSAVESREVAIKATAIARKATVHLKRLEEASPITQTIEAPEPKSYGSGEAVTVSVVDQARIDAPNDAVNPVSNRDSAKLTKLQSSNEATASL